MTLLGGLVLIEVDTLEVNNNESLLGLVKELTNGKLAVLNIFLFHEARFLEELVETTVSDVLNQD